MDKLLPVSDLTLRQFELRWRETGAVEDEVTYLQERIRARATDTKGLTVAARLGNEAARRILGEKAPEAIEPFADLLANRDLPWDDPNFAVRAVLAPGGDLVERWEAAWPESKRARKAFEEARAICRTQNKSRAAERRKAIETWRKKPDEGGDVTFQELRRAFLEMLDVACMFVLEEQEVSPFEAVQRIFWAVGKETVNQSIRTDLSSWALGYADPLA